MNPNQNKIGWCDKTLNPVVGCNIRCADWCYARRQAKRQKQNCQLCYDFVPHEHLERLKQLTPRQRPMKVFIGSMTDWNSPGVEPEWNREIIKKMIECKQHIFLILSKDPKGFKYYDFPDNVWLGTTITNSDDEWRHDDLIMSAPSNIHRFQSLEPMLGYINPKVLMGIEWIIIGGLSRQNKEPLQPPIDAVKEIIQAAYVKGQRSVYTKDNLTIISPPIRDYPREMNHTIRKVA